MLSVDAQDLSKLQCILDLLKTRSTFLKFPYLKKIFLSFPVSKSKGRYYGSFVLMIHCFPLISKGSFVIVEANSGNCSVIHFKELSGRSLKSDVSE